MYHTIMYVKRTLKFRWTKFFQTRHGTFSFVVSCNCGWWWWNDSPEVGYLL